MGGSFAPEQALCRVLAQQGVAALMVWFPFYGKRRPKGGKKQMLSADVRASVRFVRQAVMDVRRAGDWLASRPEIDRSRIGILGVSLGAVLGSLALGVDTNYRRAVLVIGGGDLAGIIFHGSRETKAIREAFLKQGYDEQKLRRQWEEIEPLTYAGRVNADGVVFINARADEVIPLRCTKALWKAMGKPKVYWMEGGHYLAMLYIDRIVKICERWMKREGR
jgi:dienelactone hydrolase